MTIATREKERASTVKKARATPELMMDDQAAGQQQQLAIEDGKADDDESESSSSSSSSSSSNRKKSSKKKRKKASKKDKKSRKDKKKDKTSKKATKDKKDKKDESDKEKRAREKQEEKQRDAEVKAANMVLSKFGPALLGLQPLAARPHFGQVSPAVKEPLVVLLNKLMVAVAEANAVVTAGQGAVSADLKSIAVDLGHIRQYSALATSMMSLAERGSRVLQ